KPRLLNATNANGTIPYARYFSPHGNYLAVTEDTKLVTINLKNDQVLADGLASPNEDYLLVFGAKDISTGLFGVKICDIADASCTDANVIVQGDPIWDFAHVKQIEWTGNYTLFGLVYPIPAIKYDTPIPDFDVTKGYLLRDWIIYVGTYPSRE